MSQVTPRPPSTLFAHGHPRHPLDIYSWSELLSSQTLILLVSAGWVSAVERRSHTCGPPKREADETAQHQKEFWFEEIPQSPTNTSRNDSAVWPWFCQYRPRWQDRMTQETKHILISSFSSDSLASPRLASPDLVEHTVARAAPPRPPLFSASGNAKPVPWLPCQEAIHVSILTLPCVDSSKNRASDHSRGRS